MPGSQSAIAFSRDGRLLALASMDGYVSLASTSTGLPDGAPLPVNPVPRPTPASAGNGQPGPPAPQPPPPPPSEGDRINAIAFSPDGRRHPVGLSLSIGTSALVTDPVLASFSPDGGLIALMHSSGETVAWPEWLVADPHQALCKQVGPPPSYVWSMTAPGEPEPDMCP